MKQNDRRRGASDTNDSYEMQPGRHLRPDRPPHQRSISDYSKGYGKGVAKSTATEVDDFGNSNSSPAGDSMSYATYQSEVKRSNSVGTGSKLAGLKRRIGSLRRSRRTESGDQAQL